jgi:hypothetical protein
MAEQQQGNFVPYTTGGIKPVLYGAQTQVQADQAWAQVSIFGGALVAQSGNSVFSIDPDGRLRLTFATPAADDYFAQGALNMEGGIPLLFVYSIVRTPNYATVILSDHLGAEVLVAGVGSANFQLRTFRM